MEYEDRIFKCISCESIHNATELRINRHKCTVCKRQYTNIELCTIIANYLLEKYNIITLKDTKEMLIFDCESGIYINGSILINQELSHFENILGNGMPSLINFKIECKTYIDRLQLNPPEILITQNKVIILKDNGMSEKEFNPKYYCTSKIPVIFNKTKKCKIIDKFISDIVEPKWELLTYEMIAYTLYSGYPISTFFILNGSGRNGKTILISLIQNFLGEDNFSSVSLQELLFISTFKAG